MRNFFSISLLSLMMIVVSCQVGPRYRPPPTYSPDEWAHASVDIPTVCVDSWWEIFNDPLLDELEESAVNNNNNLYIALERVEQSLALVGIARADLYPQLSVDPLYMNQGILQKIFVSSAGLPPTLREHQLQYLMPLNLSYEVDLWGRIRSQYQAAYYSYEAQEQDYLTALLILTTDVASTYFQIRTYDSQLDLYTDTIKTRKKAFEINKSRYESKIIDYLSVAQSEVDLKNVESQYYETRRLRDLQVDSLAVLVGVPASEFCVPHNPLKYPPPPIPAGIPSDVLLQRPDVWAAERQVAAENARVGVAYARFFPTLELTGAIGFSSPNLKQFLSWISRFWAMGATSDQTIFDGGRKYFELEAEWAIFEQTSSAYQQTLLIAFKEVEDSLGNLEWLAKESVTVGEAVIAAKKAYKISYDRFYQGVDFYLNVVEAERQELDNERIQNGILGLQYISTVQLIRALGGSWFCTDMWCDTDLF